MALPAFAGFTTPAHAQDASAVSSSVEVTHGDVQAPPTEGGQCQSELGVSLEGALACNYCNLPVCGCVVIEGCALEFSCSCSPIFCTRSCRILFCVP